MAPHLSSHHQQVAYLSFRIAEELALPYEQIKSVFLAALVHDIGALSINEKLTLIDAEPFNANEHAFRSAKLFENFIPMRSAAPVIRYHHLPWDHGNGTQYQGKPVPYECHNLHLADRVCANLQNNHYDITHIQQLIDNLGKQSSESFDPKLIEVIRKLAKKEYIWLDLISHSPIHNILELGVLMSCLPISMTSLHFRNLRQIIDFRSSFTARLCGSRLLAAALAELLRFSAYECKMMEIAGYLHDLGKLSSRRNPRKTGR
jgi:response regulator RpfG family c-di-GMP phosphodiesterase